VRDRCRTGIGAHPSVCQTRPVPHVATRYHCTVCGNLTRFDVVTTRRTRSFHHYTLAGELAVEDVEVLDEVVEHVSCRWCSASGTAIEAITGARQDAAVSVDE
jgi:uncharacterized protein CbrC (UPF0167 family)